jgi:hypothetical protein
MQEFDAKLEYSRKSREIDVCQLTQFFFIIKPISQCRQRWWQLLCGGSGSLASALRQRWRQRGGSGCGGSLTTTQWRQRQRSGSSCIAKGAAWRQKHGSMVAVAAAQRQQQWWQRNSSVAAAVWQHDGGNMRMRCCKVFAVEVQNMYLWNMFHMIVS